MIFVSYRILDTNEVVARLDDSLAAEFGRVAVFRDKTRLAGGVDWPETIEENAKSCQIMLVVIGKKWASESFSEGKYKGFPRLYDPEDWVRKEITLALTPDKSVIPILVDGAKMPDRNWLANFGLEQLADKQGVPLRTDDYDDDFSKLVELLRDTSKNLPRDYLPLPGKHEEISAAERRWSYLQTHPIRGVEILLILKDEVGVGWFREVLDETQLSFTHSSECLRLGELLSLAPPANTKEQSREDDQPLCSFWELYLPEHGFWVKRIAPESHLPGRVAGFDTRVPWPLLKVPGVTRLNEISLLTDFGVSFPARMFHVGIEHFAINFVGDDFSFSIDLDEHGLDFLHEMAHEQHKAINAGATPIPIGVHFSGLQLLEMFRFQLFPKKRKKDDKRNVGFSGVSGTGGKAITFYPTMPPGFHNSTEFNDYTFTFTMPARIDSTKEIKQYKEKLRENPADTESYVKLAVLYQYEGRLHESIQCLESAIKCAPVNDDVHGLMGQALVKLGRFDEALPHFRKAVDMSPAKAMAHASFGACLHDLGELDEALVHFETAVKLEPSDARHQANLRLALTNLNRYSEAIAPARRAVELNPDDAENVALLGVLLEMDGKADEAMPYIEKATQLNQNSATFHELLGNQLAKNGEHLRAVDSLQRATKIEPNAHRFDLLGASLAELERWPEAEAAFESGLKLGPGDHQRRVNLAIVQHRLGKIEQAIDLCKSAIVIQEVADTYGLLGQLYACAGRLTEAEVATGRSLELAPDDPGLLANRASVLAALGRTREAVSCLERSLSADPANTTIHQMLEELTKSPAGSSEA